MSGTNVPTSLFEIAMQRDPQFANRVRSLERCLRVRERGVSSGGRSGEPAGSCSSGAGACEKELQGLRGGAAGGAGFFETDYEGFEDGASPCADVSCAGR